MLAAGLSKTDEGRPTRLEALKTLWECKASEPQTLLSAGKTALSPAASASMGSKMVSPPVPVLCKIALAIRAWLCP